MATTNILVVEDQRAVAGALRMRLRGLGYAVLDIAKDGDEAIEKADSLRPDLILMDIRLGDGIDGIEAARRIRSRFDIPVVYVSAYADRDLLDRARATQPAGFINKPFTTKDLLTTINLALDRNKSAAADERRNLREAVLTTDGKGQISFLSRGAEQLTGWSRRNVIGQPLAQVLTRLYPLTDSAAATLVTRVIDTGEDARLHRRGASGDEAGDILSALSDARGVRFGVALRFDGYTVESSLAVLQRQVDGGRFILDQLPVGAILVDAKLNISFMNAHASAIIDSSTALRVEDNRLLLQDSSAAEVLRSNVHQISEGATTGIIADGNEADLLVLECYPDSAEPRIVALARPVPESNAITDTPQVSLMIYDLGERPALSASVLQRIYGLTRSEVRLVQRLVGGCSLEDGANELGISVNTARTHLKHIFNKTGAKRQSELIHKIETGPASLGVEIGKKSRSRRIRADSHKPS